MIDHVWSVLCARAIIDKQTNSISIHDVIEQITIKGEPASNGLLPMQFDLVSFWIRSNPKEPTIGEMRMSFISPSGDKKMGLEGPIKLTDHERIRNIIRIENLPIHEPGRHYFTLEQKVDNDDWKQVAAIPLSVVFEPLEEKIGEK